MVSLDRVDSRRYLITHEKQIALSILALVSLVTVVRAESVFKKESSASVFLTSTGKSFHSGFSSVSLTEFDHSQEVKLVENFRGKGTLSAKLEEIIPHQEPDSYRLTITYANGTFHTSSYFIGPLDGLQAYLTLEDGSDLIDLHLIVHQ